VRASRTWKSLPAGKLNLCARVSGTLIRVTRVNSMQPVRARLSAAANGTVGDFHGAHERRAVLWASGVQRRTRRSRRGDDGATLTTS
jgi:hypothetical protein